jgi:hypothetical protein
LPTVGAVGKEILEKKNKKRFADGRATSAVGKAAVSLTAHRLTWRLCRWLTRGRRQTSLCRRNVCRWRFADGHVGLPSAKPLPMAIQTLLMAAGHRQTSRIR